MRGLIWTAVEAADDELAIAIQQAASFFFDNKSQLGEAAVAALLQFPGRSAAAPLAIIRRRVKAQTQQHLLDATLDLLAERLGYDRENLSDSPLPTFGFQQIGRLEQTVGDVKVELRIVGSRDTETSWRNADGSLLKAVPARVKRDHAESLAELKATANGIREALGGLATRMEGSLLTATAWPFATWRRRLIDHPIAAAIARSLIWQIEGDGISALVLSREDRLTDVIGRPVVVSAAGAVRLWHPISAAAEEVTAWRARLESDGVTQPFKQAHRETYVVTDAEKRTGTYSNRFAAHILRQSQFRALAKARGWRTGLMGPWDGGDRGVAERRIRPWHVRAEFWLNGTDEIGTLDIHTFLPIRCDSTRLAPQSH